MDLKEAFELSRLKWEWIVSNDGDDDGLLDAIPSLRGLMGDCGLCEYNFRVINRAGCSTCPINMGLDDGCVNVDHPFNIWCNDPTKANAQAVLDLINEEYKKL